MTPVVIADPKHIRGKDAIDIAAQAIWRAKCYRSLVVLFVLPTGDVRIAARGSKTELGYSRRWPDSLVGVYSAEAAIADIADDVRATERAV